MSDSMKSARSQAKSMASAKLSKFGGHRSSHAMRDGGSPKGYAAGGGVMPDMGEVGGGPTRPNMGKPGRSKPSSKGKGAKGKGGTNVNVIIMPKDGGGDKGMPMPPPGAGPGGPPMPPPDMPPPPMRKHGGRVGFKKGGRVNPERIGMVKMDASAANGEGREDKLKAYGRRVAKGKTPKY